MMFFTGCVDTLPHSLVASADTGEAAILCRRADADTAVPLIAYNESVMLLEIPLW